MRIVTWNCNGALRKKFDKIQTLNADIYIIQECENPEETKQQNYKDWSSNHLWIGDNKNKGLGIFAKKSIRILPLDWTDKFKDHRVKYFLPCKVNNDFDLLGVWTHKNKSPNFGYIGQLWKYLQVNKSEINHTIIAGDLNSNVIWYEWDRWWNHSDVVKELGELGIKSAYHEFKQEEQGKESISTLCFRKDKNKRYHIDYLFAPNEYVQKLDNLVIGEIDNWLEFSDHMPLICDFKID